MTISLYKTSVPDLRAVPHQPLGRARQGGGLCRGEEDRPSVLLNTRLAPDMFPLVRQVRAATDHAVNACGRLAGVELPTFANTEASIPELKERIAKTIEFLKGLKPAQIDGSEDKEIKITFPSGATREFTGQSLLLNNRCRTSISTAPPPTTSCAIAGWSSASAISWARRCRCSSGG